MDRSGELDMMYGQEWRTVDVLTRVLFWCIIYTKLTPEWAHKQFVMTLSYFLHDMINPQIDGLVQERRNSIANALE